MTDTKLDPEKTWIRATRIGQLVVATVFLTAGYLDLKWTVSAVGKEQKEDRDALTKSIDGLREDMRRIFIDSVSTRQSQAWLELFRALNKDQFIQLKITVPDLPR